MKNNIYPFIPKSTIHLERGQFWAIPLSDGTYGAGCVIGEHLNNGKPSRRAFIAGVLSWHDRSPPTAERLFGREVFKYGFAHIKAITDAGGQILGKAALKMSGLPKSAESLALPGWGYNFSVVVAHQYAGIKLDR